jgi:diguanylate cyclase (GGDEF)-like protein/PAS domain S-box-containing protein
MMDIESITKAQLIKKIIEQHRKIKVLEEGPEGNNSTATDIDDKSNHECESLLKTNSVGILTIDKSGTITSCNEALLKFSGYKREDLIGKYFTKRLSMSTRDIPKYVSIFRDILAGREAEPFQVIQESTDGGKRYGEVYFSPILNGADKFAGFKIIVKDITARKELEEKLIKSDEKLDSLMEISRDGMIIHKKGIILKANNAFLDIFNLRSRDPEGRDVIEFISEDDREKFSQSIIEDSAETLKIYGIRSTGSRVYLEISGKSISYKGREARIEIFHDISILEKSEKRIKYLKFHDSLTELYNRTYMEQILGNIYRERHLPLNFIICDLNGLKLVNDAFGYREGDRLLKRVARILKYCVKKEDIVARWGSDEFFILLPESTSGEVEEVINKIKGICSNTENEKIPLNISTGVSTRYDSGQDFRKIIREAENNMYKNKLLKRKSIYNSIIISLERMLWEKSHETREHAERLKGLAVKLGKCINMPQSKLDELILLSSLHDIGKVAIPDSILLKKGKLNSDEWKIIKRHPEIGYNIAKSTPHISIIADDILSHHEWWDGSGYPQGLKGDEIPANSCITSIVDAYDVMIMGRPYKSPVSVEEARDELKRCAGRQFNPFLVEKFLNYC